MRIDDILNALKARFANAECELSFSTSFQLLVAVILSAQCTDKRVNQITDKLFKVYKTPADFAALSPEELIPYIRSAGFFNNKARSIIEASKDIMVRFGGNVPSSVEELVSLRGVGKKTANVVYAVGFNGEAIAVDTHVFRVSNRLGLVSTKNPQQTERELTKLIAPNRLTESHHLLLFLGRYICKARKPDCANCPVTSYCAHYLGN